MKRLLIFVSDGPALYLTEEQLWCYISEHRDDDPYNILKSPHNKYAIGRAKVWGSSAERRAKYGRD
jgi:hypothetical protein